jgi:hypothetical protein
MLFKRVTIVIWLLLAAGSVSAVIIDKIAAIVNDDVITQSEIYAVSNLNLDISGLPKRDSVLQRRIDYHLVLQQLLKQPPVNVPESDVQAVLEGFSRRHGGPEEILIFLNSIGMNFSDFEQEVRNQLSIQAFIRLRFRPFVNIRLEEAQKYYEQVYKPRLEKQGKPVPEFEESLDAIQTEMSETTVQQRTTEWLDSLRQTATINIKE